MLAANKKGKRCSPTKKAYCINGRYNEIEEEV